MQLKFSSIRMKAGNRNSTKVLAIIFFSIFSISHCYAAPVAVGDSLGGGTVFCVSDTPDTSKCVTTGSGEYGLIMANVDQANYDSNSYHGVTWSSENKTTNAQSDYDGAANTATIIAALPHDNSTNNAAWLCHNYKTSEGYIGPGLSGWYLPSKNELNKMYLYAKANNLIGRDCTGKKDNGLQCLLGGDNEEYVYYWSSTEYSGYYDGAWGQRFSGFSRGYQYYYGKIINHFVARAVRAFNNLTIQQFINDMRATLYSVLDTMPIELINIITNYVTEIPNRDMLRNTEYLTQTWWCKHQKSEST